MILAKIAGIIDSGGERWLDHPACSLYVLPVAAARTSARGQRTAILASPLRELTGFYLSVDCLGPDCGGERTFAIAELASFCGHQSTVGDVLCRVRCSGGCSGRVGAAWLVTGPI